MLSPHCGQKLKNGNEAKKKKNREQMEIINFGVNISAI
jgi:hypothetical protein